MQQQRAYLACLVIQHFSVHVESLLCKANFLPKDHRSEIILFRRIIVSDLSAPDPEVHLVHGLLRKWTICLMPAVERPLARSNMEHRRPITFACLVGFLLAALLLGGCSSASYIRASSSDNPLERVAQQAHADWAVERVNTTTLHLSDAWPIHSIFSLGYSASHAILFYDDADSTLNVQYYFQSNQLPLLFIPFSLDAEPGFAGAGLKLTMNNQIDDIIRWSGSTIISRRAGERSEPFPPQPTSKPMATVTSGK